LPLVNPLMADADKPAFVLGHVAYGVAVGLVYPVLHPHTPSAQLTPIAWPSDAGNGEETGG
jgi:hypothetical protein